MRKMTSIQKVREIVPHNNADALEIAMVNDWQVVVKKGEFKKDQLVVYFEVDSWIPHEIAAFLSKGKEPREYEGVKGERLRTIKLRGEISQGLVLPTEVGIGGFLYVKSKNGVEVIQEGDDVSEILNVKKWEPTIPACLRGRVKGNFPAEIPKTDQERIQNLSKYFDRIKEQEWEITEKLHGCFLRGQLIETWGGGSVTIGDIVSGKINPTLIGVDSDGNVVPCTVTNTFKNGVKNNWLLLQFDPFSRSKIVGKSGEIVITSNHKVFRKNLVEVAAGKLHEGDEILMQEEHYCEKAMHYFRSGLLGDGHVGGKGHYSYNEGHTTKHSEYLSYILNIFENVPTSTRVQISGFGSKMQHIKVFATSQLKRLQEEWYGSGKISLPEDISWIDDFSVAKWYMDDGSLSHSEKQNDRACFATNSFSERDVNRLADKLKELYNVSTTVYNAQGWRIRVNYSEGSIHSMWKAIAPHIPHSMRYKIPAEYSDSPFIPYGKVSCLKKKLVPVKVISVSEIEPTSVKLRSSRVGYDIETTTHNYFCGGLLVHNSSMTCFLDNDRNFHVCSRNLDLQYEENNSYWKVALNYNLEEKMQKHNLQGYAIQGELVGEGVNGNQYGIKGLDLYVFDIYSVKDNRYLSPSERIDIVNTLQLKHVPVVSRGTKIQVDSIQELLKLVDGKKSSINGSNIEGWVFKTEDMCYDDRDVKSFKVISNTWLLKNE